MFIASPPVKFLEEEPHTSDLIACGWSGSIRQLAEYKGITQEIVNIRNLSWRHRPLKK